MYVYQRPAYTVRCTANFLTQHLSSATFLSVKTFLPSPPPLPSLIPFPHFFLPSSHPPIQVGEWQLPVCKGGASKSEDQRVEAARAYAQSKGLKIGGAGYSFAGSFSRKGLYAYKSGQYAGRAYFGTGGTEEQERAPFDGTKYRVAMPDAATIQCASTFESGRMTKTRSVKQEPLNGGKACPALSMEYRCPLDACTEKKSTSCSTHATTTYLGRHPVDCPTDMALQKIQLRKCEDTSKMRYDYTCVAAQTAGSKKGAAAKSETTNESDAGGGATVNLDKHNVGEKCVAEAAMSGFKLLESTVKSPRSERDTSPSAGSFPRDIAVTGVGAGKAFEMQWDMKVATMNADTVHYATVIGGGDNCRNAKGQDAAPKGRSFLKGYEWLKLGLAKNTWYSYKLSVTETGYEVEANGKVVKTEADGSSEYSINNKITLGQHFCAGSKYPRGTGEYKNVKITTEVPASPTSNRVRYNYECVTVRDPAMV